MKRWHWLALVVVLLGGVAVAQYGGSPGGTDNPIWTSEWITGAPGVFPGSGCTTYPGGGRVCGDNKGSLLITGDGGLISNGNLTTDAGAQFNLGADGGITIRGSVAGDPLVTGGEPIGVPTIIGNDSTENAAGTLHLYQDLLIWPGPMNTGGGRVVIEGNYGNNGQGFGELTTWDIDIEGITNIANANWNMLTEANGVPLFPYGLAVDGGELTLGATVGFSYPGGSSCFAGACASGEYASSEIGVAYTSDIGTTSAQFFEPLIATGASFSGATAVSAGGEIVSGTFVADAGSFATASIASSQANFIATVSGLDGGAPPSTPMYCEIGEVTFSTATTVSTNFQRTFTHAPICVCSLGTETSGTVGPQKCASSTTQFTLTEAASSTGQVNYICCGQ